MNRLPVRAVGNDDDNNNNRGGQLAQQLDAGDHLPSYNFVRRNGRATAEKHRLPLKSFVRVRTENGDAHSTTAKL